jgi:uncharacterized membrane protein
VAHLIAIGYADDARAAVAAADVRRMAAERIFEPRAVATVARGPDGRYGVPMTRSAAAWDTVRGLLALGMFAWRPVLGLTVAVGVGSIRGRRAAFAPAFADDVRAALAPGTSALFLAVDKVTPDEAIENLSRHGGTVLRSSLSREAEHELDDALRRPLARPHAG